MEVASEKWFSDLGMEDPTFNYCPSQLSTFDYPIDDLSFDSFSSKFDPIFNPQTSQNLGSETSVERPKKQQKTNSWYSCITDPITSQSTPSSSPQIISFEKSSQQLYGLKPKTEIESNSFSDDQFGASRKVSGGSGRNTSHRQDHVLAERKRRERLSQRFIALSALVSGLKKMDKASVLGDAIKYLKHMQERVKTLEEQIAKKALESAIFVKKSQVYSEDESSSVEKNSDGWSDQSLPEIEARVSDKDVLIRIHCEKRKGYLQKILTLIEKLNLNVINTNALPFGNSSIDVTILAKVEGEFMITVKEVVKNIRLALT